MLAQDYPGEVRVIVVDDRSTDGMAERVPDGAHVVGGLATPDSWGGKVWAMQQGVTAFGSAPDLIWFTDADIVHEQGALRRLVERSTDGFQLVSVMAELRTATRWERLVIPAFVYYFAMLYPFRRGVAAAGGSMLVDAGTLERSGGLGAMSDARIDDVTLAQQIRRAGGRVWLGFDRGSRSVRPYPHLADLWNMVARNAYDELDHSPVALAGTLISLAVMYLAPIAALAFGPGLAFRLVGGLTVGLQVATYLPMVRHYRLWPSWALTLPLAGVLYGAMTASSAWRHHAGRSRHSG